jgi:catechol 2,3-dioxygenase-like lactoylglutathione lyase family enzyme
MAQHLTDMIFDTPGRVKCGTVLTPDFEASLTDYTAVLDMQVVENTIVAEELAQAWHAPSLAGRKMAVLQPASGAACYIRLIAGTQVPGYQPIRSYGWISLELTVDNVWDVHQRVAAVPGFNVIGPPKLVDGFSNFIPMQVVGRAGEVLYLNQVIHNTETLDLPKAKSMVDHIFITVLAAPDRQSALDFYTSKAGFTAGGTYEIVYSVINNAFTLPAATKHAITMTHVGSLPCIEIDQYPQQTIARPMLPGELPPGVGMVTYLVESLDGIAAECLAAPQFQTGVVYGGRRSATIIGPCGEYLELIEMAA